MAVIDWSTWMPQEKAVLVVLLDGPNLLAIHKKRGLGQGKVTVPGGRVEPGETWKEAAAREMLEETGLSVHALSESAQLQFQFTDGYALAARVFLANDWTGTLRACDEAVPFWVSTSCLPWDNMWADDPLWLPPVLRNRLVSGHFVFDGDKMDQAMVQVQGRPGDVKNG